MESRKHLQERDLLPAEGALSQGQQPPSPLGNGIYQSFVCVPRDVRELEAQDRTALGIEQARLNSLQHEQRLPDQLVFRQGYLQRFGRPSLSSPAYFAMTGPARRHPTTRALQRSTTRSLAVL